MLKKIIYFIFITALILAIPASISASFRDNALIISKQITQPLISLEVNGLNFLRSIRQIHTLRQDKQKLQEKILTLQKEVVEKENIIRENESLKKELGVQNNQKEIAKVFGRIIVRGNNPLDRTFTVDVGEQQGVRVGQPAVYQGFLVGKVIQTKQQSSIIRTIRSRESIIQVWLSNNREKGLLIGDGNSVYLSDINQEIPVLEDTIIETSGLGGSLPQGLVVGEVGSKQSKPSDLSQKFLVNPSQDPMLIESVFILLTDSSNL